MLFYLAFLSACAFTLQGYLLKYNPVSKVAVFKSTNPLFGALFSAIILSETAQLLHYTTLIALALVCGGILVINLLGEKRIFRKMPAIQEAGETSAPQESAAPDAYADGFKAQAENNAAESLENADKNEAHNPQRGDKPTDDEN